MSDRIVHLHQVPLGVQAILARVAKVRACATVVPSQFMAAQLAGTHVLENWVEEVHPVPTSNGKASGDVVRLGFLGRLSLDKGVHVLADALHELDAQAPGRYRLVLAGEPRFVDETSQRAVHDALAPVEHLVDRRGWMTRESFFGLVDVMVCPSVWAEPFGLVIAEAMSARTPFVISDTGALREVAGPNHPWLAPPGDVLRLADAVQKAARDSSPELLEEAYNRWHSRFSPTAGRKRLHSLFADLGLLQSQATEADGL
ncbi:glycosyltransferase family 4 protein [Arthrobacter sp. ISL-28]|uniref:glycosyltransferase family 4 protein n=1 Tax=Arthrobacter sp. ISL-28 TaxID=2819108 RepID=UPI001BEA07A6|nr:glycosyltransferase family 4 protein [Arthrobacter sp. ISL-28]MBT2519654.1 glycosyltransferase family 4 protein [Arthrobacter sp. ISL-28]